MTNQAEKTSGTRRQGRERPTGGGVHPGPWRPEDLRVAVVFLRSLRGWSQTDLARAAGMDKSRISLYEQGRKVPSPRSLGKLVAAAGLPFPVFESVVSFIRRVRAAAAGGAASPHPAGAQDTAAEIARAVAEAVEVAAAEACAELAIELPRASAGVRRMT